MTSYFLTYSFYRKMSRLKVFSIKFLIERAVNKLSTIILKFFEKKIHWETISKNRWVVCEISTDFQSENNLEITKQRRINF